MLISYYCFVAAVFSVLIITFVVAIHYTLGAIAVMGVLRVVLSTAGENCTDGRGAKAIYCHEQSGPDQATAPPASAPAGEAGCQGDGGPIQATPTHE
jgi:hypothetical protein